MPASEEPRDRPYTAEEVAWATRRLDMAMSRLMVDMACALDVSVPELLALDYITSAQGSGPTELAHRLRITTGAVTALVDRLEDKDQLRREPHHDDRRRVMLRTTPAADAGLGRHIGPMAADIVALARSFDDRERQAIGRFLDELIVLLERHADRACSQPPTPKERP